MRTQTHTQINRYQWTRCVPRLGCRKEPAKEWSHIAGVAHIPQYTCFRYRGMVSVRRIVANKGPGTERLLHPPADGARVLLQRTQSRRYRFTDAHTYVDTHTHHPAHPTRARAGSVDRGDFAPICNQEHDIVCPRHLFRVSCVQNGPGGASRGPKGGSGEPKNGPNLVFFRPNLTFFRC
jgi:hypothetical protein